MLDLSYLNARRIVITKNLDNIHFIQVGCGGTGAWITPHLARIIRILKNTYSSKIRYTLIDPDKIEEKNLARQNFCAAEIGMNKAEALAIRYGSAYGISIEAISESFRSRMVSETYGVCNIILGCVDNYLARREIASLIAQNNLYNAPIWWLDSGNYAYGGQVLLGTTTHTSRLREAFPDGQEYCVDVPSPAVIAPDLMEPPPAGAEEAASCVEMAIRSTQSLAINQQLAAIATNYIVRLLGGTLKTFATEVNIEAQTMTSRYATKEEFAKILGEPDFYQLAPEATAGRNPRQPAALTAVAIPENFAGPFPADDEDDNYDEDDEDLGDEDYETAYRRVDE